MKSFFLCFSVVLVSLAFGSCKTEIKNVPVQKIGISEYLGQWTLDIKGGSVGWLEVRQENGYIDADLLWVGGSVNPVADVYLANDKYLIVTMTNEVVRRKDEKNIPLRTHLITEWFEMTKNGDKLEGYRLRPKLNGIGVDSTSFIGTKLPPVTPAPDLAKLKFGNPINLFNGKDLTGWKLIEGNRKNGFSVVDGILVNDPVQIEGQHLEYGNLRTIQEFEDFNLKCEVNVPKESNSGVYLRGMYEVQVLDSYKKELDSHNMGAVYSRIKPLVSAEKPAGTWQTFDITLCDRHVTVILNGIKIIDNQPVYGPTGGAIKSDVFSPGPIFLQGDHGKVSYRNIVITPIVK